jgi:hypothetical protein
MEALSHAFKHFSLHIWHLTFTVIIPPADLILTLLKVQCSTYSTSAHFSNELPDIHCGVFFVTSFFRVVAATTQETLERIVVSQQTPTQLQ